MLPTSRVAPRHPAPAAHRQAPGDDDRTAPCACSPRRSLKLMGFPGGIALWCPDCELCVPPDASGLPEACLREVRRFARQFDHIYGLWLESSEYEGWAAWELFRPASALNRLGRIVAFHVAATVPCFFALENNPTEPGEPRDALACPICGRPPAPSGFEGALRRLCRGCGLLLD